MNTTPHGYLDFLKSLSEYQQRAEIGRLPFTERWSSSSLEEDILKLFGHDPYMWEFDLKHYAEESDLFDTPIFRDEQCISPFRFLFTRSQDPNSQENLLIKGLIYIDDDASALIGTLTCSFTQEKSRSRDRLLNLGIDPDEAPGGYTVDPWLKHQPGVLYLDYLRTLTTHDQQQAIFYLAERAWGSDNPKFLAHPELAAELEKFGISDLIEADRAHWVGPVEFHNGRCTAPLTYYLYGSAPNWMHPELGPDFFGTEPSFFVEVHILAEIGNGRKGEGTIAIRNIWFYIDSVCYPQFDSIPELVS
jgi:hypothetical protein